VGAHELIDRILWQGDGAWQEANIMDALLHQLRAPLGASSYALDALVRLREREDVMNDVETERMLRTAQMGVMEAQALVRWFYRVRKLTHGRLEPEMEVVSVQNVLERALSLLPEARVRVRLVRDVPAVAVDSLWLTQILTNLIENATKHTPERAMAQVFVRRYSPEYVVVSVVDNGRGIPPERQREIFRPAAQPALEDDDEAHGIGLSIVQYFVRAMGGRIWIESDGRSGTTVRFTVPIATSDGGPQWHT